MLRHRLLLWVAALPLFVVQPLLASIVQVGTCKTNVASYPTISAAVSAVSAGSTVEVCPGTYAEQVTITEALTLVGVAQGSADQVVITVPDDGLVANAASIFGQPVAAQLLIQSASPVNITNIAVDGTGGDMACVSNTWIAGIFYTSTSSGTLNKVRASNQIDGGCGVAIWAENGDTENQSVTIENSSAYNVDNAGIFTASGGTPSLSVNLIGNVVNASGVAGIVAQNVTGQIRTNIISNTSIGVFGNAAGINIAGNTVVASGYGIYLVQGGTATGNNVSGSNTGVLLAAPGATVKNNRVVSSAGVGLELGCFTATVSGNTIYDAPVGIDQDAGSLGSNNFGNSATTITQGCAAGAAAPAARPMLAKSQGQWRTPATPFGTRTK